ncbi:MAG: hypothetical protein ACM3S4_04905 [Burkholderiales bacterium]
MALEESRFFDYTEDKPNEYQADEFCEYFRVFLTSGVPVMGTNLQVTAPDTGMLVNLNYGTALVHGGGYFLKDDGNGLKTLDIAAAHPSYTRIDRVVLRRDISIAVSSIVAVIKPGTPSANPQPPALTREGNIYVISLAQVRVEPGVISIAADKVIDERADNDVCGYVENRSVREQIAAIYTALSAGLAGKAAINHTQEMNTITGLIDALAGKANSSHNHVISGVSGLSEALAGKLSNAAGAVGSSSLANGSVNYSKLAVDIITAFMHIGGNTANPDTIGESGVYWVAGPFTGIILDLHWGSMYAVQIRNIMGTHQLDFRVRYGSATVWGPWTPIYTGNNILFGTSDMPPEGDYPAGTIYIQYEE